MGYNIGKASIFERTVVEGRFPWLADTRPADKGKYVLYFNHGDGFPSYEIDSIAFFRVADLGLQISRAPPASDGTSQVTIRFNVQPGQDYFVEYRGGIHPIWAWATLPGGPFNSGVAIDFSADSQRYYRVRAVPRDP